MHHHIGEGSNNSKNLACKIIAFVGAILCTSSAYTNPVLGNIASGNVSIQQSTNTTTIHQSSQQAIINWQSFNIGQGQATHFQQPAGGIALNRISPTQGPSSIYGVLTATGQIILINPAGIYFGPSAVVNVGGLIATTANISNANFLHGNYQFLNAGPGSIINAGQLIAAEHGLIALVGSNVTNTGLIQANLGHVVLATGSAFTVNFDGNDLINFSVGGTAGHVTNTGSLIANGGQVMVSAATAQNVLDNVINMQGVVEAKSVYQQNGDIVISGDPNGGVVKVAANINASGKHQHQTGGTVMISGYDTLLESPTTIDVSGNAGGGHIQIGRDNQGQLANTTTIDNNVSLLANTYSGSGGLIETSGEQLNLGDNLAINTSSVVGKTGTWLLDPTDIYIAANQSNATSAGMTSTDTSANTGTGSNPETFAGSGSTPDSLLTTSTLDSELNNTNVIVSTANASGTGTGNITVVDPITWSSTNTLELLADNNIAINNSISAINGSLTLSAANDITTGSSGSVNVANFQLLQGSWIQTASLPAFNVSNNFSISSGAQFERTAGGDGSSGSPFQIVDIYGLQGIATLAMSNNYVLNNNIDATVTAHWSTTSGFSPIGTTTTPYSGTFNGNSFTINYLSVKNLGATNRGLFGVNTGTIENVGLINALVSGNKNTGALVGSNGIGSTGGSVINSYSSNGNVSSSIASVTDVGGLVGNNVAATSSISNSYATGILDFFSTGTSTASIIGGLAGANAGTITDSYANVAFSALSGSSDVGVSTVGGLVGSNSATGVISNSYSLGSNTVGNLSGNIGGFVGNNAGIISNSYSTTTQLGAADFLTNVGSFAAVNSGSITGSYATGSITTATTDNIDIGGFVGNNTGTGTLSNNFFDTTTTGISHTVGCGSSNNCAGVTGVPTSSMELLSTFSSVWNITSTPGTTTAPSATWFIFNGETRPILLSEWSTDITSAHQLQLIAAAPDASYTIGSNINLTNTNNKFDIWATSTTSGVTTGQGFIPIGSATSPFEGSLTGNGNVISNLLINSSGSDIGLLGDNNGTVSGLSLTGVSIKGTGTNVGGIAGVNDNSIDSSYVSGSIAGASNIGGIAGDNNDTISNSYNLATIAGSTGSTDVGGLVGSNNGDISDSYSSGAVSGTSAAGGLAGVNTGTITNSFWDTQTSGQSSSAGGSPLTTALMQNISSFTGWDITDIPSTTVTTPNNIWFIFDGFTRPMLLSEWNAEINNVHQLQLAGSTLGADYSVMSALNLTSVKTNTDVWGTNSTSGAGFAPIGNSVTPFSGTFDSEYNPLTSSTLGVISNLYINAPGTSDVGLFGANSGTLENFDIQNAVVTGGNNSGILVGDNSGNINNITIATTTTSTLSAANASNVGGLAGTNEATGTINDSNNTAQLIITGTSSNIGGLAGSNAGTISNSNSTGSIIAVKVT